MTTKKLINMKKLMLLLLILIVIFIGVKYELKNSYDSQNVVVNETKDNGLNKNEEDSVDTLEEVLPYKDYKVSELIYSTKITDPPDSTFDSIPDPDTGYINNILSDINLRIEIEKNNKMLLTSNYFEYEINLIEDESQDILQSSRGGYVKHSQDGDLFLTPKKIDPLFITPFGEEIEVNGEEHIIGIVDLDGINYMTVTFGFYNYVLSLER